MRGKRWKRIRNRKELEERITNILQWDQERMQLEAILDAIKEYEDATKVVDLGITNLEVLIDAISRTANSNKKDEG